MIEPVPKAIPTTTRSAAASSQGVIHAGAATIYVYEDVLSEMVGYADSDLMLAPFNQTTRTAGSTTQWGDLISCWDCHANPADTGTITYSVTAHGGAETLRGASTVTGVASAGNAATRCLLCHDMTSYSSTVETGSGVGIGHGPNSAALNLDRNDKTPYLMYGCNLCHSSSYNPVAARPARSEDVHGTNVVPNSTNGNTKSQRWATGPDLGPVAFIRNSNQFATHSPSSIGANNYTAQCMGGDNGFGPCTRGSIEDYLTGGGTY